MNKSGYCRKCYSTTDKCKKYHREYQQRPEAKKNRRIYYQKNKDKLLKQHKEYYQKNKDKISKQQRKYRKKLKNDK